MLVESTARRSAGAAWVAAANFRDTATFDAADELCRTCSPTGSSAARYGLVVRHYLQHHVRMVTKIRKDTPARGRARLPRPRPGGTVRKSVPLTADDQQELDRIRAPHSRERAALGELTGIELGEQASDAELLHALVLAGRAAITDQIMDTGYAEWAASETDEDREFERMTRARRRDRQDED